MSPKYFYLLVNIGAIFFPLLFSFEKRIAFYKMLKYVLPAITLSAIPFIIFDQYYTLHGVWYFNPKYILGIKIFSLPLEELLFFFTIPYACLFMYEALNKIFKEPAFFNANKNLISTSVIFVCLTLAIVFYNRVYTSVICFATAALISLFTFVLRAKYMGKYWRFFAIQLIPFFIVNGFLTGTAFNNDVFWYRNNAIINFRIGTIPVEDIFFALSLLLVNVFFYEKFKHFKLFLSFNKFIKA